jgi:hypothetical protein
VTFGHLARPPGLLVKNCGNTDVRSAAILSRGMPNGAGGTRQKGCRRVPSALCCAQCSAGCAVPSAVQCWAVSSAVQCWDVPSAVQCCAVPSAVQCCAVSSAVQCCALERALSTRHCAAADSLPVFTACTAMPPIYLHCTVLHCTALHCTALHCKAGPST